MEYHMVTLDPSACKPKWDLEAMNILKDLGAAKETVGGESQD